MDRLVKERLVGAAVLMAAAIILIPEMLSGPDRDSAGEREVRSDGPMKTYTIDLTQSHNGQSHNGQPAVIDNRAPPPEEPPPAEKQEPPQQAPAAQVSAAQPDPANQAKPEPPEQSPAKAPAASEQPTAAPTRSTPTTRALASNANAPTSGGWAVQIGSYSKEATAERIAKQLRDQGRSAFVMPVKSGGATLYRVRIGPMKDRASAEAMLRDVKSAGAAIVPHP